ncbi:Peptidase S8, subtilisin, Ser-active site protein [Metarhizium robertsii ARSEF 23]|uniref:Peptidase S8, subtilisin, Ser-active site protein n=1 Tax=Metarhizium robertsii (strain ARSEF 23 / ATCC MYA-3075) TaxID=655844 RepID=E9F3A1_METRA|nr:Peptidase S8, subtilisin, Ser-active site protein [Metarhizium robertsii ARSEF 23]EFY97967.1 Peptidase S8, subtilisin, Ser-active site protein [Metarhizium robertsii ARSEF 23]
MLVNIKLYQSINDLTYPTLRRSENNPFESSTGDDQEARKSKAAAKFQVFEAGAPLVSDSRGNLEAIFRVDELCKQGWNDSALNQIETLLGDEVRDFGSKIQVNPEAGMTAHENVDEPEAKAKEYIDALSQTGLPDPRFHLTVFPASLDEGLAGLKQKTELNARIEKRTQAVCSPLLLKPQPDYSAAVEFADPTKLYELLATRKHCSEWRHSAFLLLSDPDDSDILFSMYLSSSWNLRELQIPKLISGLHHRSIPLDEKNLTPVSLGALMTGEELKTVTLDDEVRKAWLAHRLSLSLRLLYMGPWIQQDWDFDTLHIMPKNNSELLPPIDELYIGCTLAPGYEMANSTPTARCSPYSSQMCPKFFLSFAQLLVDILKGERGYRSYSESQLNDWFYMLQYEVGHNLKEMSNEYYWRAIEGCILFTMHDDSHECADALVRAKDVISKHIITYLRMHVESCQAKHSRCLQPDGTSEETGIRLWSEIESKYQQIDSPKARGEDSFVTHMNRFTATFIKNLPALEKKVRVAIIDSGFYVHECDPWLNNPAVEARIGEKRNFFSPDDNDPDKSKWQDMTGHGTQVARLVLQFAPLAEVVIAKITNSPTLKYTKTERLVEALKWAGERADIINLSFSLGTLPIIDVQKEINNLVDNKKLVFAAASTNAAKWASRAWPARERGVFAIHASDETGETCAGINPDPLSEDDNFLAFGLEVDSFWDGRYQRISGTSFATPVAAAIAADMIELARRIPESNFGEDITRYRVMRNLFLKYMSENKVPGNFHRLVPWTEKLWDWNGPVETQEKFKYALRDVITFC